jgi:leader peptidase (prepilin peptidase)/N-methyltransferase
MIILLTVLFTLIGLAIGSFLNVCIDRLPAHKSLVSPASRCDACEKVLTVRDLMPVFSYLILRGRCRFCGAKIPLRVLLVETLSGLIFFLAFWRFGLSPQFGIAVFWSSIFLVVIFIDWEHQLILNKITYPAAVVALLLLGVDSVFPGAGILEDLKMVPQPSILSGLIGGGVAFLFFLIVFLINPRGMGMGDIKLVALIGLAMGIPFSIIALLIGIVIGGIIAIIILALKIKGRKDVIAYGTFLAIGPILMLLWGSEIWHWYQNLFK